MIFECCGALFHMVELITMFPYNGFMHLCLDDGEYKDAAREYSLRTKTWNMCKAKTRVFLAVRAGLLPRARLMMCVDCGNRASVWDHRDYLKPLDVQPVCRPCNKSRGPGLNREHQRPHAAVNELQDLR